MEGQHDESPRKTVGEEPLRVARLYRRAAALGLSAEVRDRLEVLLLASMGYTTPPPPTASGPAADELWKTSLEHCQLKLRQLVQVRASWEQLSACAWHCYRLHPQGEAAARLVEYAALYGSGEAAAAVIAGLCQERGDALFYAEVHPAVRSGLIAALARSSEGGGILSLLAAEREAVWLEPAERLGVFIVLGRGEDAASAYSYFKRFAKELLAGVQAVGPQLRMSPSGLYFWAARLAAQLGALQEAASYLKHIEPSDCEYADALKLLAGLGAHQELIAKSAWGERLAQAATSHARLQCLGQFLAEAAESERELDLNSLALNAVVDEPLRWFPAEPAVWQELALLLTRYDGLRAKLPSLRSLFIKSALRLYPPQLDAALWEVFLQREEAGEDCDPYFIGVALLHRYLRHAGRENEETLWRARSIIRAAEDADSTSTYQPWARFQPWALQCVEDASAGLSPSVRKTLLCQVRVAAEPREWTLHDLSQYLAEAGRAPLTALAELQTFAAQQGAQEIELAILLKAARTAHLTRPDLGRLWHLAAAREQSDLAWRVATVGLQRGLCDGPVQQAWSISGENRRVYPWQALKAADVDACLSGFTPEEARLAWACVKLGVSVPCLLASLDKSITLVRTSQAPAGSHELQIERHLATLKWFGALKRDYQVGGQKLQVPAFAEVLPGREWSLLVASLAHRLGVASWGWRLSRLTEVLGDLAPKAKHSWQAFYDDQSPAARWLRSLSSEQRGAWADLIALCRKLNDERALQVLATFICRLATVIYPDHKQALEALHEMRAPFILIWQLENWMLSEEYSQVRRRSGLEHVMRVPEAVRGEWTWTS